ncbi:E3 ubiquitin-protein ligase TRIM11 [Xyrauchen texanus]|uniref:E3 ubiquitin-protein ligase TRIM11 n=1 Tax=Xyrauchen texanus TaxID=154827 RepID=UPI0022426455|nr:E3 ubiquitin-protein ligase TRIM11 [Xyrauchen texanus]
MSTKVEVSKTASYVMCDLCVEGETLALKTCLKCEVSMCALHLQPHLTSPVLLQTHPLTKPVLPASTGQVVSRCSAHGKLVEYYCLDDHVLVCMSCAIEDGHRLHNMKTLQTAHKDLVGKLREEFKALAERQDQANNLESWNKGQRQILENSVSQLVKTGSLLKDQVFTSLQTSVSARLGALHTAQQAVSSALKEEDHFIFLQRFSSVHKALEEARMVDLRQGLESKTARIQLVEEIRKNAQIIEEQVDKLQGKFLAFIDPENHPVPQYESNPVSEMAFDPKTLGSGMTLSKDLKTLFYNFSPTNPTQPNRASHGMQTIRCLQTNESSLRWFLRLSEHCDWTIGLCNKSATNGNYSDVYGLKIKNKTISSLHTIYDSQSNYYNSLHRYTETVTVPCEFQATFPWKLEVIWDCTSNILTIYSRNKLTKGFLLYKHKLDYTRGLCPFITLENITSNLQDSRNLNQQMIPDQTTYGHSYTEILCILNNN